MVLVLIIRLGRQRPGRPILWAAFDSILPQYVGRQLAAIG